MKLAYLTEAFNLHNSFIFSNEGGFIPSMKKTELWRRRIQDGVTDMLPKLTEFLHTPSLSVAIVSEIAITLTELREHFSSHFSSVNTVACDWV